MADPFSRKQKQILAFPNSDYDALICDGSVRSGKTSIMSVAFVLWAMRDFTNCNFGICSKTVQTAVKNVIKPLMNMQYLQKRFTMKYSRTTGELVISRGDRQNVFYIYGGKDESSYMLIQGITLAGVFLDEVALMPRSFVEQALARCSVDGSKFWFNCNPEGPLHWFNVEWVEQPEAHNALRLHFTMADNPSLTQKIRERYESMYSGVFYDRYIKGLWVAADGIIYDMFDRDVHVLTEEPETEGDYWVSSDFGIQNATVFLLWRRIKNTNHWVCLREWYYSGRDEKKQKTVAELVDGLQDMLAGIDPKAVIIDPSATALILECKKRGYRTRRADNDVLNGIADVSTMLHQNRLYYMASCKGLIEEKGLYAWDAKAADRGEDRPIKDHDHACDAERYFVHTLRLVKRDASGDSKEDRFNMFL